jgi:hypothetical protein
MRKNIIKRAGQVILEYTFCMIILMLMIYSVMMILRWAGRDLVERRRQHDAVLISGTDPIAQVVPQFYESKKMDAIWDGDRRF